MKRALLLLAACGGDDMTSPDASTSNVYTLETCRSWSDHPRPYTPESQFYNSCTIR